MSKRRIATAGEFKPKRSRYAEDEHAKDERQLAAIVLTAALGAVIILALHHRYVRLVYQLI